MRYVIINTSDLNDIDLSEFEDVEIKFNVEKTECILNFNGEIPKSLRKIKPVDVGNRYYHTHKEMMLLKKMATIDLSLGWVTIEDLK